jgi:hypothetical protein
MFYAGEVARLALGGTLPCFPLEYYPFPGFEPLSSNGPGKALEPLQWMVMEGSEVLQAFGGLLRGKRRTLRIW